MRTRWLVGLAVLFAAGVVQAQQAAPDQPANDPSATQPTGAQTGASPAPTLAPEASSQPSTGDTGTASAVAPNAAAPGPATDGSPAGDAMATAATAPTPVVIDWSQTAPGDAAAGETKAATCGACHGLDGNSAAAMYPKIAGQHEWYIARQLALYKSGERVDPVMQGFAAPLTPQDMRDIGAFYASKQTVPGLASDAPVVADGEETWAALGQRLYRAGDREAGTPACMACHGPGGRGNPGSRYPALGGQHADYTRQKLTQFRDGTVWGAGENASTVMAEIAKSLDDQDIEALSTYLEGLHAPGRRGSSAAAAGGAR